MIIIKLQSLGYAICESYKIHNYVYDLRNNQAYLSNSLAYLSNL